VTGEENGHTGPDDAERTWLVDPLCGTLNYAARTMLVAVNVPLGEGSGITAAAVVDPFSGEVFWTDGRRACVRRGDADTKLSPSADSRLVDVNLDPPFPNAPAFRAVSPPAAYVTDGHLGDSVHRRAARDDRRTQPPAGGLIAVGSR
jgi:myo-inositol-1(or 4)-monophosphatase